MGEEELRAPGAGGAVLGAMIEGAAEGTEEREQAPGMGQKSDDAAKLEQVKGGELGAQLGRIVAVIEDAAFMEAFARTRGVGAIHRKQQLARGAEEAGEGGQQLTAGGRLGNVLEDLSANNGVKLGVRQGQAGQIGLAETECGMSGSALAHMQQTSESKIKRDHGGAAAQSGQADAADAATGVEQAQTLPGLQARQHRFALDLPLVTHAAGREVGEHPLAAGALVALELVGRGGQRHAPLGCQGSGIRLTGWNT